MPRAIAPVTAASASASRCWNALECAAAGAARNVHGAPDAPADDERAAELVGDVGPQEQVAVARAALGIAAGDVVEDADGHPPGGETGEVLTSSTMHSLRTIISPAAGVSSNANTPRSISSLGASLVNSRVLGSSVC
jgi:hypothetical protein